VRRDHDDVGTLAPHLGHVPGGLLDEAAEAHLPLDVGLVPDGDPGVGQAEDADLDRLAVRGPDRPDDVRRERGLAVLVVGRVRRQQREVELLLERAQVRDAVVELVVAQRRGVVADRVHGRGHGVLDARRDRLDLRVVVRERGALDGVARVDEERVAVAAVRPDLVHERRDLGQTHVVVGAVVVLRVLEVVPVQSAAVQVRRAHDRELVLGGVVATALGVVVAGRRGRGERRDEDRGRGQRSRPDPAALQDGEAHVADLPCCRFCTGLRCAAHGTPSG
jgi:hypothetical protein